MIFENGTKIIGTVDKVSKKLDTFYNPVMKDNRDITIQLLNSIDKKNMQICDLLAGSGIRSIRFIKELKKGKIKTLFVNDKSADFFKTIKQNFILNKMPFKKVKFYTNYSDFKYKIDKVGQNINKKLITDKINITNEEANSLLYKTCGFDYIEIDPFGSPNPFLDASVKMLARDGILGVTATDTAALTGTYLKPTLRKYWGTSLKNELMHELGLRILIRKIQLIGAQYEKALFPILSYSKDHYFRVFVRCKKSKNEVDKIQKLHKYLLHCPVCFRSEYSDYNHKECCKKMLWAGPMCSGKIQDSKILKKMRLLEDSFFLKLLSEENAIDSDGFYDIHAISKKRRKPVKYKFEDLISEIKKQKFFASRSHFSPLGIKTNMPAKKLLRLLV